MPVLEHGPRKDILLLWAGNNTFGSTAYYRYPLCLAYSSDKTKTWDRILDLYSGTTLSGVYDTAQQNCVVQADMEKTGYKGSDDWLFAWTNHWNGNRTILIEDFEDFLYKTQGAANTFGGSSFEYDGWYNLHDGGFMARLGLSAEHSRDGSLSLKITDGKNSNVRIARTFPSARKGKIILDLYLQNNAGGFWVDLGSAIGYSRTAGVPIAFKIGSDGEISTCDTTQSKEITDVVTSSGKSAKLNAWNTFTVEYDLPARKAVLSMNGEHICDLPVKYNEAEADSTIACVMLGNAHTTVPVPNLQAYLGRFIMEDTSLPRPTVLGPAKTR